MVKSANWLNYPWLQIVVYYVSVLLFSTSFMQLVAAQMPPPPKTSAPSATDYSVSTKCSSIFDANKIQFVEWGEALNLIFAPMVMACEGTVCTKIYKSACEPQGCPLCKYFSGPANRFQAQIENVDGEKMGSSCDVKRISHMYLISCAANNPFANLTASYVLKVYAKQLNGSTSLLNKTTGVVFHAGDISIKDSGPGYWSNGNEFGVGELSSLMFPVKDKYNNLKNKTTGAASEAQIKYAFGQLPENSTSYLTSFRLNYDKESGLVNATFIPIMLGTWHLSLGQPSLGYIGDSPYIFEVVTSGPISPQNCIAAWSSEESTMMAGEVGYAMIFLKDAYNNAVNISTGWSDIMNFSLVVVSKEGTVCKDCAILTAIPGAGYETAVVNVTLAGYYKLNISSGSVLVRGSPLYFNVVAGIEYARRVILGLHSNDDFQVVSGICRF